ncbi:hypothetical protein [Streptomyces sp. NPDC047974]|uniref:hypothetical protein n=1 Tax=Streptomyces sp. NPDC047974 TaxID=3154343 RepID=UPI0033CBA3C4
MSGPKCTAYRCDESLTTAELRVAAHDTAMREAIRRREEAAREAALRAAYARDAAVREAKARNVRIEALTRFRDELAERYGDTVTVRLPEPLRLGEQATHLLEAWCAETGRALAAAERTLREQAARAFAADLFGDVTGEVTGDVTGDGAGRRPVGVAELLADRPKPTGGPGSARGEDGPGENTEDAGRTLTRVLSRLLPDCDASHRAEAHAAAVRVARAAGPGEARAWLTETRLRVQRANAAAEAGRRETEEAVRLLHDLDTPGAPDGTRGPGSTPDTEADSVRALLAEVVAGRRALDAPLRRRAAACRAAAEAEAERRYVVHTVTDVLADLGYRVSSGFETLTVADGTVRLSRGEWPDHAVNLVVDQRRGELRTAVVRTTAARGDDDAHLDVEREEQWCEDFRALRGRLAQAGLRTDVQVAVPPGQVPVPLAEPLPTAASGARTRPAYRERER